MIKLAKAAFISSPTRYVNIWSPADIDKLEIVDHKNFKKVVNDCRFFYERDPIASTVINKTVDIGITEIILEKNNLSENEFRAFLGLQPFLQEFAENCALEYLLSGLVIPEVSYSAVSKEQLELMGVKKYSTLTLPTSMFLRDPTTIKINSTFMTDKPSYYVIIPEDLIIFIKNKGKYPDGTKDENLYIQLKTLFPEFVAQVESGVKEVLLENDNIIRRKVTTKSPYPVPYLFASLEALKHKRNLRRMDYSISSRVITAIQLFQLGSDEYPITEDDSTAFDDLKDQMSWRQSGGRDLEKIFQLFANHTLKITWVYPDVAALLNEKKYIEVNQDIFFAMGFPRILTVGENERTQSSDPEFASVSAVKSMESMQRQIYKIINNIVIETGKKNGFKSTPSVRFAKINLVAFADFISSMKYLYDTGNISRTTLDGAFGYVLNEELEKRKAETEKLEKLGLNPFEAQPFTSPDTNQNNNKKEPVKEPEDQE